MAYTSKKLAKAFEISEAIYQKSLILDDYKSDWVAVNEAFAELFDFDSPYDFIDAQCDWRNSQKDTRYMERA